MLDQREEIVMADKFDPPTPIKSDAAHAILRAGLGTIPIGGAAATELLNAIVAPPLDGRRQKWMERVGIALRKLEQSKGVNLEDLQNNDVFLDTVIQATQLALRTSQEEKLEALRNAILNATLDDFPEVAMQQMFLNFIDFLTVWHIRLLTFLNDPAECATEKGIDYSSTLMGGMSRFIETVFPELGGRRDLYEQWGNDLHSRGLIVTNNFQVTESGHDLVRSKTTALGKQFLEYITNPINDEQIAD